MKTSSTKRFLGLVLLALALAFGAWKILPKFRGNTEKPPVESSGEAPQSGAKAQAAVPAKETLVELAASDVWALRSLPLSQGLAISGGLKAANSALIKARVAGELQGLTLREGDAVKTGQLIARVDSTEYTARVRQAQQTADAAKAQIDIAQLQYNNNLALVEKGFISKAALDTSSASLQSAKANHQAAIAGLDVAKTALRDTELKSPISGIVSQRLAQPGERVGVDARVLEVVDLSRLELEAQLAAADSVDVRIGQSAVLKVEGREQDLQARIVRINPNATAGSRSVLVYLSVAAQPGLRQGLFAQGYLQTQSQQALAAPLSAVRTDKPQPYVQLIQNGKIVHQTVQLGARGEWEGQTMVAINNLAAPAQLTLQSAGFIAENTAVKMASSAPIAASSAPK